MKRILLLVLCHVMLLIAPCIHAQSMSNQEQLRTLLAYAVRANHFNALYPQEKVYLHMDNRSYFIGDTLFSKLMCSMHPPISSQGNCGEVTC